MDGTEEEGDEQAERPLLFDKLPVHLHEQIEEHGHVAHRIPLGAVDPLQVRAPALLLGSGASRGLGLAGEGEQGERFAGLALKADD